jgi:hypothetical protein
MRRAIRPVAFGLTGLMMVVAQAALADVKAGVDAWNRGDYHAAVDDWRPEAMAGDPDAEFNLGQAYKLGRGVPVDLVMAEDWYRKAALQGHQQAEDNYGLALFQNGKQADAVPWLEKSAARGEPRAQLVLGTMLYNGDGVARDWPRAYALIVRANASGLPQAASVQTQMDQYIPQDDRQRGLALAQQYEAGAQQTELPPEIAGQGTQSAMQSADLPPSSYDPNAPRNPGVFTAPQYAQANQPPPAYVPPSPRPEPRPVEAAPPPRAVPPPAAPVRVVQSGGWRVQFGAFRDESNARGLWESLKARVPGLRNLQPYLVHSGTLTKLQAGPLASSTEVARLCAAVKPTGTPCVPVAP